MSWRDRKHGRKGEGAEESEDRCDGEPIKGEAVEQEEPMDIYNLLISHIFLKLVPSDLNFLFGNWYAWLLAISVLHIVIILLPVIYSVNMVVI